ncbi:MAG TPA: ferredoxin-type protein NapF [Gammaproteobacteria bacterium]
MATSINRMQFLRGDFSGRQSPLRPPWAKSEAEFIESCTACNECLSACPQKIIVKGRAGYPLVDFNLGECVFCERCLQACPTDALEKTGDQPWQIQAEISPSCLTMKGVVCRSCSEHCETRAIRFIARVGEVARPQINSQSCNGCGACVAVCPVAAVEIHHAAQI